MNKLGYFLPEKEIEFLLEMYIISIVIIAIGQAPIIPSLFKLRFLLIFIVTDLFISLFYVFDCLLLRIIFPSLSKSLI